MASLSQLIWDHLCFGIDTQGITDATNDDDGHGDEDYCSCVFSSLPDDITTDILSRLPEKSVQACKLVCWLWHRLCTAPNFAEMHLNRASSYSRTILTDCKVGCTGVQVVAIDDDKTSYWDENYNRDGWCKDFRLKGVEKTKTLIKGFLYASCNGLLFIGDKGNNATGGKVCVISNPVTRQEIGLHIPREEILEILGFFFNRPEKEYKLLLYDKSNRDGMNYCVYGLSTKKRTKLRFPDCYSFECYNQEPAVAANAALFWKVCVTEDFDGIFLTSMAIAVHDFRTQDLRLKPLPEDITYASSSLHNNVVRLLEVDGKLCACHASLEAIRVYSLTEVEKWSWETRCVVHFFEYTYRELHAKVKELPVVMGILNGHLVVFWRECGVYWYDPRRKHRNRYLKCPPSYSWSLHGTSYTKSFVSLKHGNILKPLN